jgi:hypothetical protein
MISSRQSNRLVNLPVGLYVRIAWRAQLKFNRAADKLGLQILQNFWPKV